MDPSLLGKPGFEVGLSHLLLVESGPAIWKAVQLLPHRNFLSTNYFIRYVVLNIAASASWDSHA